ncbi:MAG: lipid droplet-associated protein, partial [Pseudonocardiaceae bacterium]
MSPMPLPVRVAAGLMVTALERARKLPDQIAELPVTAASRAVQAGMRLQQRVTELAIKGDEVFSLFRQVEDTPPWARFDEDDGLRGPGADTAVTPDAALNGAATGSADTEESAPPESDPPESDPPESDTAGSDIAGSADEPLALPGYDKLTLAQLRGRLRALSLTELEALLEHEHTHQDRAPFVTMLSNR